MSDQDKTTTKRKTNAELGADVEALTQLVHQLTDSMERLSARCTCLEQGVSAGQGDRLAAIEDRLAIMEVAKPKELRVLSADEVKKICTEAPSAQLEVVTDWSQMPFTFGQGQTIRCDHYPHIVSMVRSGLQVAIPEDRSARVEQARELAVALERQARASHAAATAKRAETEARQAVASLD